MTELLYQTDSYLQDFDAVVIDVRNTMGPGADNEVIARVDHELLLNPQYYFFPVIVIPDLIQAI